MDRFKKMKLVLSALPLILVTPLALGDTISLQEKVSLIYELEDYCGSVSDPPASVGESCINKLTAYFADQPIWNNATMILHDGGRPKIHDWLLNKRERYLKFGPADLTGDNLPTWGDIFDGKIKDRMTVVANVLEVDMCKNLKEHGEIQPHLSEKCEAQELFKYATYLDVCMTGFSRSSYLHGINGITGLSVYDSARENINRAQIIDETEGNNWQLVENYLHTLWITHKCSSMQFMPMNKDLEPVRMTSGVGSFSEMEETLLSLHGSLMAVAARAGNMWAINSYYERGLGADIEYWKSLHKVNPLLFHRWMATNIGNLWLEDDDQLLHAMKAYEMEKQLMPEVADLEPAQYLRQSSIGNLVNSLERLEPIASSELEDKLKYPWDSIKDELVDSKIH